MKTLADFLADKSPMHRAKAKAAIEMQVRVNGAEFMTRQALIESRVAAGARIALTKHSGRVLMSPDGAFFDTRNITATGLDYASYLTESAA